MAAKVTTNDTVFNNGYYRKDFNLLGLEGLKLETGAILTTQGDTQLAFPEYGTEYSDTFILLPRNLLHYFPDDENIRFSGIQIKPEFVNRIFPNNLNWYVLKLKITYVVTEYKIFSQQH